MKYTQQWIEVNLSSFCKEKSHCRSRMCSQNFSNILKYVCAMSPNYVPKLGTFPYRHSIFPHNFIILWSMLWWHCHGKAFLLKTSKYPVVESVGVTVTVTFPVCFPEFFPSFCCWFFVLKYCVVLGNWNDINWENKWSYFPNNAHKFVFTLLFENKTMFCSLECCP